MSDNQTPLGNENSYTPEFLESLYKKIGLTDKSKPYTIELLSVESESRTEAGDGNITIIDSCSSLSPRNMMQYPCIAPDHFHCFRAGIFV